MSIFVANPSFSLDKWGEDVANDDLFKRFKYGTLPIMVLDMTE